MKNVVSKKVALASLSAAVILFIWYMFSWMVLPWHSSTINKFKNETSLSRTVKANATHSGIYILPNPFYRTKGQSKKFI